MLRNLKIWSRFHIKLKNSKKKNHNNPASPLSFVQTPHHYLLQCWHKKRIHTHFQKSHAPDLTESNEWNLPEGTDQSLTCTINEIATSPWLLCCASLILWYNSALYPYTCIWNRERHVEREETGGQDLFWPRNNNRDPLALDSQLRRQISRGTGRRRRGRDRGRFVAGGCTRTERSSCPKLQRPSSAPSPSPSLPSN